MFAGKIIDMDTGLAMAQIMDPTTRMEIGIFTNFYYYFNFAAFNDFGFA